MSTQACDPLRALEAIEQICLAVQAQQLNANVLTNIYTSGLWHTAHVTAKKTAGADCLAAVERLRDVMREEHMPVVCIEPAQQCLACIGAFALHTREGQCGPRSFKCAIEGVADFLAAIFLSLKGLEGQSDVACKQARQRINELETILDEFKEERTEIAKQNTQLRDETHAFEKLQHELIAYNSQLSLSANDMSRKDDILRQLDGSQQQVEQLLTRLIEQGEVTESLRQQSPRREDAREQGNHMHRDATNLVAEEQARMIEKLNAMVQDYEVREAIDKRRIAELKMNNEQLHAAVKELTLKLEKATEMNYKGYVDPGTPQSLEMSPKSFTFTKRRGVHSSTESKLLRTISEDSASDFTDKNCGLTIRDFADHDDRAHFGSTAAFGSSMSFSGFANLSLLSQTVFYFVEVGEFKIRLGRLENLAMKSLAEVPCCIAKPTKGKDASELVASATIKAGDMYKIFRETGMFTGQDAWYVCFEHPDSSLRGQLELVRPIQHGIVRDPVALAAILQRVFAPYKDEIEAGLLVASAKMHSPAEDRASVAQAIFDSADLIQCCFLAEPPLTVVGMQRTTGIVVDIGAELTVVTPVYEGMVLAESIRTSKIGGESLTKFMAFLISGLHHEHYSHLLNRRQQFVARQVKEQTAFVVEDFDVAVGYWGTCEFDAVKAWPWAGMAPSKEQIPDIDTRLSMIQHNVEMRNPDGADVSMTVDRERFHCPELLFKPNMFTETKDEASLIDIIKLSMESVQSFVVEDMVKAIILCGATSRIAGLPERVKRELDQVFHGCDHKCTVMLAEDDHTPTAAWRGAILRLLGATGQLDREVYGSICNPTLENLITLVDFVDGHLQLMQNLI